MNSMCSRRPHKNTMPSLCRCMLAVLRFAAWLLLFACMLSCTAEPQAARLCLLLESLVWCDVQDALQQQIDEKKRRKEEELRRCCPWF